MTEKKNIAILGAGTMGVGIAQLFAAAGHAVMLIYVYDDKVRSRPMETMTANLNFLRDEGVVTAEEIPAILGRVRCTESLEEAAAFANVIIECIVENLAVKQDYFQKLDALCPPETILATNTSAISVTEIAEKSEHKERIIGTHFWNPAYLIPLVEVINTAYASPAVVEEMCAVLRGANKMPVVVKKDVPGFLANRMQHALLREAISIVESGIADAADVDNAIKYGFGMRLGVSGPMEVIDRGGLDLTFNIHKYLFPHIENSEEPSKLMVKLMEEGKLGFKSGEGFQTWTAEEIAASNENLNKQLIAVIRSLGRL
ncbi:MAG: 3-hydroxyacyl-CoA dehydrogenase family protein [Clostridia bacterium]|nr:3-hydroxyacyl-CoA dehydrogenase family protein [Clostridia bacterium]